MLQECAQQAKQAVVQAELTHLCAEEQTKQAALQALHTIHMHAQVSRSAIQHCCDL